MTKNVRFSEYPVRGEGERLRVWDIFRKLYAFYRKAGLTRAQSFGAAVDDFFDFI